MRESIKKCQQAGITVRMVTGDNLQTACSIAEKCGIISKGDKSVCVIEGPNFRQRVRDNDGNVSLSQHVYVCVSCICMCVMYMYICLFVLKVIHAPQKYVRNFCLKGIMVSLPSPFAYYYPACSFFVNHY